MHSIVATTHRWRYAVAACLSVGLVTLASVWISLNQLKAEHSEEIHLSEEPGIGLAHMKAALSSALSELARCRKRNSILSAELAKLTQHRQLSNTTSLRPGCLCSCKDDVSPNRTSYNSTMYSQTSSVSANFTALPNVSTNATVVMMANVSSSGAVANLTNTTSSNSTERRVALCLYGSRMPALAFTGTGLFRHVVLPLDADVFIAALEEPAARDVLRDGHWNDSALFRQRIRAAVWRQQLNASDFTRTVLQNMSESTIRVLKQWRLSNALNPVFGWDQHGGGMWEIKWIQECFDMVRAEERRRDQQYGWISFMRFEMLWLYDHPPLEVLQMEHALWTSYYSGFSGLQFWFMLCPRELCSVYGDRYDALLNGSFVQAFLNEKHNCHGCNAERFLWQWTQVRRVRVMGFAPVSGLACIPDSFAHLCSGQDNCYSAHVCKQGQRWKYRESSFHDHWPPERVVDALQVAGGWSSVAINDTFGTLTGQGRPLSRGFPWKRKLPYPHDFSGGGLEPWIGAKDFAYWVPPTPSPTPRAQRCPANANTPIPVPSPASMTATAPPSMIVTFDNKSCDLTAPPLYCKDTRGVYRYMRGNSNHRRTHDGALYCLANKHVVLTGDTRVRYQYLSLVSFLTTGVWPRCVEDVEDVEGVHGDIPQAGVPGVDTIHTCGPVNEAVWPRDSHNGPDWATFFRGSTLANNRNGSAELCDCHRCNGDQPACKHDYLENRFYQKHTMFGTIRVTYIQIWYHTHIRLTRGFPPMQNFSNAQLHLPCEPGKGCNKYQVFNIEQVLQQFVKPLQPTHLFLGGGHNQYRTPTEDWDMGCILQQFMESRACDTRLQHAFVMTHPCNSDGKRNSGQQSCGVPVFDRYNFTCGAPAQLWWDREHLRGSINEELNHLLMDAVCGALS